MNTWVIMIQVKVWAVVTDILIPWHGQPLKEINHLKQLHTVMPNAT